MARNGLNSALLCSRLFVNQTAVGTGRKMVAKIADGELSWSNGRSSNYWNQNLVLSTAAAGQRLLSTYNVKSMHINVATAVSPPDAAAAAIPSIDDRVAEIASNVSVEQQRQTKKTSEVWLDELIELLDAGKIRLIDVREPTEIEEMGSIPTSINIPLTELKRALMMPDGLFKKMYGVVKPRLDDHRIVFYGLTYIRSAAAVELAQRLGYKRVRQYVGGWYEWSIMCRTDC